MCAKTWSLTGTRAKIEREWPTKALRHGFGSFHLARFNDTAALALQIGNSPGTIYSAAGQPCMNIRFIAGWL